MLKVQLVYRCSDIIKFTYIHTYVHGYVLCKEITVNNSQSVLIISFCFFASSAVAFFVDFPTFVIVLSDSICLIEGILDCSIHLLDGIRGAQLDSDFISLLSYL